MDKNTYMDGLEKAGYSIRAGRPFSKDDLLAVKELAGICNRFEELNMKLNWGTLQFRSPDETNDFFCYYADGTLAGYLAMFCFGGPEIEISGMVHPEHRRKGIFSCLLNQAVSESRERGIKNLLFICERSSSSGHGFVTALGTKPSHSEYRMELIKYPASASEEKSAEGAKKGGIFRDDPAVIAPKGRIILKPADTGDFPDIAHIDALSFNIPEEDCMKFYSESRLHSNDAIYVALLDGRSIGAIKLHDDGMFILILGVGILPEFRGKGLGREMLNVAVDLAYSRRPGKVALEVDCDNNIALSLYKSVGFDITNTYDYYRLKLR